MFKKLLRIYEWLPILWRDEDWDYSYLLILIKYKLSRMERVIGSPKSFAAHWEHRKVELANAQLLISKCKEDPDNEWDAHYNQYHIAATDCSDTFACDVAIKASMKREEKNWKAIWAYLSLHAQGWWD